MSARNITLLRWVAPAMVIIGCIAIARGVKGAEREDRYPPTHQLIVCEPGKECQKRGRQMGATACNLDLASDRLQADLPPGTWLTCVKAGK